MLCNRNYTPTPRRGRGVYCFTSVRPSVQDIFRHIFLSNCWWQKSDIWSQASYRYPISWEAFFDRSDSYFLFAEERGYHKWALAHSSSCFYFLSQCISYQLNLYSATTFLMWPYFTVPLEGHLRQVLLYFVLSQNNSLKSQYPVI